MYRDCRFPLTSYGILLFRYNKSIEDVQYLMICRRHTFGYVEFIRANYQILNRDYIKQLLMEMTVHERNKIQTMSFKELWMDLWQQKNVHYNHEFNTAHYTFKRLMNSEMCKELLRTLPKSVWTQPEWGFPKGKRNVSESPLECAVREMQEETGLFYNQGYTSIIGDSDSHGLPKQVAEIFQSTDKSVYRHIYYLYRHVGNVDYTLNAKNIMQMREVSDIMWLTYDECMVCIRSYNIAKKKMLSTVHPKIVAYCKKEKNDSSNDQNCAHHNHKGNELTNQSSPSENGKDLTLYKTPHCQRALRVIVE